MYRSVAEAARTRGMFLSLHWIGRVCRSVVVTSESVFLAMVQQNKRHYLSLHTVAAASDRFPRWLEGKLG